jgi:hypothetical protein
MSNGYKMSILGEPINNHQNYIEPSDFGSPSMKSIDRSCQAPWGIGKGYSRPGGKLLECLACWHTEHCLTKSSTSCFMPLQWNRPFILWKVAWMPECPPTALECIAVIILVLNEEFWEIHNFPLYLINPFYRVYPCSSGLCVDVKSTPHAKHTARRTRWLNTHCRIRSVRVNFPWNWHMMKNS